MNKLTKPAWLKNQVVAGDFEIIHAPRTDPMKDLKLDPSGFYVLIKVILEKEQIAVAICNSAHETIRVFQGYRARDIWSAIFDYEKDHNHNWFKAKDHAAYLGKELKKAELALAFGNMSYFQE